MGTAPKLDRIFLMAGTILASGYCLLPRNAQAVPGVSPSGAYTYTADFGLRAQQDITITSEANISPNQSTSVAVFAEDSANVDITGGTLTGGSTGGAGVWASEDSVVSISGGTISGGRGLRSSGSGVINFSGGDASSSNTFGNAQGAFLASDADHTITGGSISGADFGLIIDRGSVTLSEQDGPMTIGGVIRAQQTATVDILGGTLTGGLHAVGRAGVLFEQTGYYGYQSLSPAVRPTVSMSGGAMTGAASIEEGAILELSGNASIADYAGSVVTLSGTPESYVYSSGYSSGSSNTYYATYSRLAMSGGSIVASGPSGIGIAAGLNAETEISGGSVSGATGVVLSENATLVLTGGSVTGTGGTAIEASGDGARLGLGGGSVTGDIEASGNATVIISDTGVTDIDGVLTLSDGASLGGDGALQASQTVIGDGGSLSAGQSPGSLTLITDLEIGAGGHLLFEIDDDGFDALGIDGNLLLDPSATVEFRFIGDTVPTEDLDITFMAVDGAVTDPGGLLNTENLLLTVAGGFGLGELPALRLTESEGEFTLSAFSEAGATVPAPAALGLMIVGGAALLRRRR